jgi:sporulation protein YlmC with PRC-barrel domain
VSTAFGVTRANRRWLSQATGQQVFGFDGRRLGRVADLSIGLDAAGGPPRVRRLVIRRRSAPNALVPWAAVVESDRDRVCLNEDATAAAESAAVALASDEILLARDVLDTQVVDVAGQRLARVADVVLARTSDDALEVLCVELGFGGVLRRLGMRSLAGHVREDLVPWNDLHLTSERGHAVQLDSPRSTVHHLDEAGLATLIDRLDVESAAEVLATTQPGLAARVVHLTDPAIGEQVLRALPEDDAAGIVAAMPDEHARRWRARLGRTPAHLGHRRPFRFQSWPRRRGGTTGPPW